MNKQVCLAGRNILIPLVLAILFFIVGLVTIPDYNISWDEILHFSRGQVYLNYFLTGSKEYPKMEQKKSYFQIDYQYGDFWFKENGGHPPISDILATVSNYIFYKKLGVMSDIGAYHLFNVVAASFLVFVVSYFAMITLGVFPSIISFLVLVTYPLFFAESHFNVKDVPEAAFFSATILFFYLSLVKKKSYLILVLFLFFALALGTKFNVLFLPFIILPYFVIVYRKNFSFVKRYLPFILIGSLVAFTIFIASWPFLWNDFPQSLVKVFAYYKNIGIGTTYQPASFYIAGFNTFAWQWILFTTPPVTLFLTFVGLIAIWVNRRSKEKVWVLWLAWFLVPILRVTIPGSSIYGGIRQILEFLPAMSLLAALGSWQILRWLNRGLATKLVLAVLFIWPIFIIVKMHPNENVYFNFLIGGLKGASEVNFPSWGNSYGNAYLAGINWLNSNASLNSKLALVQGTRPNAPPILLRSDINFDNKNWSGMERGGEYLMELTFNDTGKSFYYTWEYVDKFLELVYEDKVDGVSILKIWKNDIEHTRKEFQVSEKIFNGKINLSKNNNILMIDAGKELNLSRINLSFTSTANCTAVKIIFVEDSLDGKNWYREKDWIPFPQVGYIDNLDGNVINFYFAGRRARFVRFVLEDEKSCVLVNPQVGVYNI